MNHLFNACNLFKKQTVQLLEHLEKTRPHKPIKIDVDGRNVSQDGKNWFTCFSPINWGRKAIRSSPGKGSGYGSGAGIGYAFHFTKNKYGDHYVRLYNGGGENPFIKYRDEFKKDVVLEVVKQNIPLPDGCRLWPDTKFTDFKFHGTTLMECQPVPLGDNTWEIILQNYLILDEKYNDLVAQFLRKYYEKGAFSVDLDFGK